ncbi:prion-like-(Q/N-rich) domain-bearing protein 25 [Lycorma delicatula]|uniref:prion-like-(Q/N-rich) domain-bearing protein 25 n=1 Tax=Lycorma delicatula TaxID=130591 RepID=UPI003F514AD5
MYITSIFLLKVIVTLISICKAYKNNCTDDLDCDTKGAVCKNSTCVCPDGYITNSDKTTCLVESTGYNGKCEDNIQCSAVLEAGGQCKKGKCQCASGFHYLHGKCIRSIGLGESCRNDDHCFSNYDFEATCCIDGRCQCSSGYYQREYSACRRASYAPGEPCGIAQDCHFDDAVCTMARVCDYKNTTEPTPPTFLESYGKKQEFDDRRSVLKHMNKLNDNMKYATFKVGEDCNSTEDCSFLNHSYCSSIKKCLCLPGYYNSDDLDACYPEIGSPCSDNTECVGRYMMCNNATWCTCRQGFVANSDNRFCLKMSRNIGWSCLHDKQCSFFGMGGQCVQKKCVCSENTHFEKSLLFCWRSLNVGEACLSEEDCWGEGKQCTDGFCKCTSGYHKDTNNSTCRSDALLPGDPCVENTDCVFDHSTCENGICQCGSGYFNRTNQCLTGIGGECLTDNDCNAKDSKCTGNSCSCPEGYVVSKDRSSCLSTAKTFGDHCLENEQCLKALGSTATCNNEKCVCLKNSHFVYDNINDQTSGQCYINIKLSYPCKRTAECVEVDDKNITLDRTSRAVCRKGICSCDFQYGNDLNHNYTTCTDDSNYVHARITYIISAISVILILT